MSLDYTGLGELIDDYCGPSSAELEQADDTIDVLANEIRTLREQNQSLRVALAEIELILRGAGAGK